MSLLRDCEKDEGKCCHFIEEEPSFYSPGYQCKLQYLFKLCNKDGAKLVDLDCRLL